MRRRFGLVTSGAASEWHARRLLAALAAVGEAELIEPSSLRVTCEPHRVRVRMRDGDARRFDAMVLGRVVGPRADADLQLDAARALEWAGVPCLNGADAMLAAQDKLWTAVLLSRAGIPTPDCSSLPTVASAPGALDELAPAVAKPLFGSLGEGLFRCARGDRRPLAAAIRRGPHLLQRWVDAGAIDYRLFVVAGRVEACVRREAGPGEWRANAARAARVTPFAAPRRWATVAIEAVRALGLAYGGVDLAVDASGPTVLEINGFPSFRALHAATGLDMAEPIAREAVRLARSSRRARARVQLRT